VLEGKTKSGFVQGKSARREIYPLTYDLLGSGAHTAYVSEDRSFLTQKSVVYPESSSSGAEDLLPGYTSVGEPIIQRLK
jgi:hypothetical protein